MVGTAAAVSTFFIGRPRAQAEDAELTLKLATVAPAGTPWEAHLKRLKKQLKDGTEGRVRIKAYLGGALGDENNTFSRTRNGEIHLWAGSANACASIIPEFGVFGLPYLFDDEKTADGVIDKHLRPEIEKMLEKSGFKLLFFSENGFRSIGTNFGFVKSTGDLKGKKMRCQPIDVEKDTWTALGASPQPIAVTEVMTALQTGVVDGFDNTPLFTFAASWYQAITHFTLTNHSYQPALAVISKKVWDTLPKDVQTLLAGDIQGESEYGRKKVRAIKQDLIDNFSNAGIQVHSSTSSEIAAFKKATESTHGKFTKKYGSTLYDIIKKNT
jgi:tripartite ATP-independent transporter DctP family solute receptor